MRRDDAIRARWEAVTTWPLIVASALFLVCYSWVVLVPTMPSSLAVVLAVLLAAIWASFLIDFVVRFVFSTDRTDFVRHNLVDLGSVIFPLVRPFRLLRYLRNIGPLRGDGGTSFRTRVVINATAFVVMFIYVISLAELAAERNAPGATIVSLGDSIWWACVTMATVGYGDFVPVTVPGRVLAVMLMIGGVAIVGTASATIVSFLNERIVRPRLEVSGAVNRSVAPDPRAARGAPAVPGAPGDAQQPGASEAPDPESPVSADAQERDSASTAPAESESPTGSDEV